MQCPPEIAEIVCAILRTGLLRIRALRSAERCALEADHLHNLPDLLQDYKPERLDYYWRIERIAFIKHSVPEESLDFEPLWKELANYVGAESKALAS